MSIDAHAAEIAPRMFDGQAKSAGSSRGSMAIVRAETPIRQVALLVDPSHLRFAHSELARRLAEVGIRATVMRGRSRHPLPWSAELLLELERVTRRVAGARPARPEHAEPDVRVQRDARRADRDRQIVVLRVWYLEPF